MKAYLSIFRVHFISVLQYRSAAFAGILTQFAWGFMLVLMFNAFYQSNPSAFPMGLSQVTDYIWLQQAFLNLFAVWIFDNSIFTSVTDGQIAYELVRPLSLYKHWFAKTLAFRSARTLLRCFPPLIVALSLPEPYGLSISQHLSLFLLTMLLSTCLVIAFLMLIYISTFYLLSSTGIRTLVMTIGDFLTGGIIPLPFLPDSIQHVIELTPFGLMQNVPLRVYSGDITEWTIIFPQLFWLITLIVFGQLFMKNALTRVVIQGG